MSYGPRIVVPRPHPHLSVLGMDGVGTTYRGSTTTVPSSASWVSSTNIVYHPFNIWQPYDLQRFWWQNGATVGTDSLIAAVYAASAVGPADVITASGYTLSAGTANYVQYAGVSVQAYVITSGTSSTDGTSFDTASVTLDARPGLMYALVFANSKASAAEAATSVQTTTGGTVAFTSRNSQTYGASTEGRVSMWTAVPTSDVTDTITISFSGTQTGCAWALVAFTNVDTTTNHGVVQTAVGAGNSTTPLATLGAFGSANNATFGLNANLSDTTTAPGSGFRELADINYATPTNCLQVQFRSDNDTTSDGTITSAQWGAIAAEVKSLGTTYALAPGQYYLGLWCSGTTATVFRSSVTGALGVGSYTESLTSGIPFTATPGLSQSYLVNCGITSRSSP